MYHVTRISTNGSAVSLSRDTDGDTEYDLFKLLFKFLSNSFIQEIQENAKKFRGHRGLWGSPIPPQICEIPVYASAKISTLLLFTIFLTCCCTVYTFDSLQNIFTLCSSTFNTLEMSLNYILLVQIMNHRLKVKD